MPKPISDAIINKRCHKWSILCVPWPLTSVRTALTWGSSRGRWWSRHTWWTSTSPSARPATATPPATAAARPRSARHSQVWSHTLKPLEKRARVQYNGEKKTSKEGCFFDSQDSQSVADCGKDPALMWFHGDTGPHLRCVQNSKQRKRFANVFKQFFRLLWVHGTINLRR